MVEVGRIELPCPTHIGYPMNNHDRNIAPAMGPVKRVV